MRALLLLALLAIPAPGGAEEGMTHTPVMPLCDESGRLLGLRVVIPARDLPGVLTILIPSDVCDGVPPVRRQPSGKPDKST